MVLLLEMQRVKREKISRGSELGRRVGVLNLVRSEAEGVERGGEELRCVMYADQLHTSKVNIRYCKSMLIKKPVLKTTGFQEKNKNRTCSFWLWSTRPCHRPICWARLY